MIESVTLAWATGELLVSPFGLSERGRRRLVTAGFLPDLALSLLAARWTPEGEDLVLALHRFPDVSYDRSPFALLAGRRAEGLRCRLRHLEEAAGQSPEDLLRTGWYRRGEPLVLWRLQLALLDQAERHALPAAAAARRAALERALAALPSSRDDATLRRRWFLRKRLCFERGEMVSDPLPW
jgi:hypothetical protein